MLPKLKRHFNLFEDVLVLIVAGRGREKEYFTFFFPILAHIMFPPYKRTSSTTLRQNLNSEIV